MSFQTFSLENLTNIFVSALLGLLGALILIVGLYLLGYLIFLWYKHKNREKESLDSVLLQVALPRDNEIKIDAAEQMFSSLVSIRKGGRFSFLKPSRKSPNFIR